MSEPFLAEVRIVGFNFAPRGWAFCDGQILPINQNQSLYSLLGTTYGGDGRTSFALPDLRGRTPVHVDSTHPQGQKGGVEEVSLTVAEMPNHTHEPRATGQTPAVSTQSNNLLAPTASGRGAITPYGPPNNLTPLAPGAISTVGGQAHTNMQPSLALNFCIALQGLFPPRN